MNPLYEADSVVVAGIATTLATSFLKSKFVPVAFQKYPRSTAAAVSVGASVLAYSQKGVDLSAFIHDPLQAVSYVAAVFLVATITYNNIK